MKSIIAALGLSALFGGMVFFGAVMAPLVFIVLPEPWAGTLIRMAFPCYYAYGILTAAVAVAGFVLLRKWVLAAWLGGVGLIFAGLWLVWLPHLEVLRLSGQLAAFDFGHTVSVWVNGAQLLVVLGVLVKASIHK